MTSRKNGATRLSIMALSIKGLFATLSIQDLFATFSIKGLFATTSINCLFATLSINYTQHNCASAIMLSVALLSVTIYLLLC